MWQTFALSVALLLLATSQLGTTATTLEKDSLLPSSPPASNGDRTAPTRPPDILNRPVCGKRDEDGVGFRLSGESHNESEYGEFPWMMAVMQQKSGAVDHFICGGSLIHPRVVLTAAHCVQHRTPDQLKVRGGEWDTLTNKELFYHQDLPVTEVVTHPAFYKEGLLNDVALLFLDSPFELNEVIRTVCLPPQDANFDHQICVASGWGQDGLSSSEKYQGLMKKIELPVVPSKQCQVALRTRTRLGPKFNLHKSFICAGGEKGVDTCAGDGGSPLVCHIQGSDRRFYQAGLVSWGIGCGEDMIPGVYADVASFRGWIDREMGSRQLDTSSYTV